MMSIENLIGDDFRGCVLVCEKGEIIFEKSFGYADSLYFLQL